MNADAPAPVRLAYPVRGRWRARNSPARRVPSHGTHAMGETYALDLIGVDERGRSAPWSPSMLVGTEAPEAFTGFGRPILAPSAGRIVEVHDGEEDHAARRSQITLLHYMIGQGQRARAGAPGLAGNHVAIDIGADDDGSAVRTGPGPFVLLAHLQRGSIEVAIGDVVEAGRQVARCGNSGNSTEPHLHIQVSDRTDWKRATGLPMTFEHPTAPSMPGEGEIVEA